LYILTDTIHIVCAYSDTHILLFNKHSLNTFSGFLIHTSRLLSCGSDA